MIGAIAMGLLTPFKQVGRKLGFLPRPRRTKKKKKSNGNTARKERRADGRFKKG